MKNRNAIIAILSFASAIWLMPLVIPMHQAGAQTSSDTKVLPGSAGRLIGCTKSYMPLFTTLHGNELDLFLQSNSNFGASDYCTAVWSLDKDHPTSGPASVTIHFFKRATSANYGHISCKAGMVQQSVTGTDPVLDILGGPATTTDNPGDPNNLPLTMSVPLPFLSYYPSGNQPLWYHSPETIECTFGNDYVVTSIEYTESGAD